MSGAFARPATLASCLEALAAAAKAGHARPTLLAGGTDWMVERHMVPPGQPPRPVGDIIDVTAIPELSAIHAKGDTYEIGAGVTYLALRRHADLVRDVPIFAAMAREVGAVQIQARGTLGGNLATGSPAADGVPVLAALGCTIVLVSARGERDVAFEDFFTGYRKTVMAADEMIARVRFQRPSGPWFWRKVGTRMAQSIAKVALAATARLDGARIVDVRFGMASVGPVTATLPNVRDAMRGRDRDAVRADELAAALRRDIKPIDDVRSTGEYRMHVAERLVVQFAETLRATAH